METRLKPYRDDLVTSWTFTILGFVCTFCVLIGAVFITPKEAWSLWLFVGFFSICVIILWAYSNSGLVGWRKAEDTFVQAYRAWAWRQHLFWTFVGTMVLADLGVYCRWYEGRLASECDGFLYFGSFASILLPFLSYLVSGLSHLAETELEGDSEGFESRLAVLDGGSVNLILVKEKRTRVFHIGRVKPEKLRIYVYPQYDAGRHRILVMNKATGHQYIWVEF